jgi:hypothetical protein
VLSKVAMNNKNNIFNDDDEIGDLESLISELNNNEDLTVKLNNQSKICKLLLGNEKDDANGSQEEKTDQKIKQTIREIMDSAKIELQNLKDELEAEKDEYLDSHHEQKFEKIYGIKKRFNLQISMAQNSKDPKKEDKVKVF